MRSGRNWGYDEDALTFSLDDWDMRSGRNVDATSNRVSFSLDDWDMRSGRNEHGALVEAVASLDDWDMRSGRNTTSTRVVQRSQSRRLGYALWPELLVGVRHRQG